MRPYFLVAYNFVRFRFERIARCSKFYASPIEMLSFNTKLSLHPRSIVTLGGHIVSDGRMVINADRNASLKIGHHVYFNENAMISCKESVDIGDGCRFGPNVKILDNDHCFDAISGVSDKHVTAPVSIGKNCWIGTNAVILRGTQIADNCVIGAGCIVKGIIPAGSLVTQSRELKIRPILER